MIKQQKQANNNKKRVQFVYGSRPGGRVVGANQKERIRERFLRVAIEIKVEETKSSITVITSMRERRQIGGFNF